MLTIVQSGKHGGYGGMGLSGECFGITDKGKGVRKRLGYRKALFLVTLALLRAVVAQ